MTHDLETGLRSKQEETEIDSSSKLYIACVFKIILLLKLWLIFIFPPLFPPGYPNLVVFAENARPCKKWLARSKSGWRSIWTIRIPAKERSNRWLTLLTWPWSRYGFGYGWKNVIFMILFGLWFFSLSLFGLRVVVDFFSLHENHTSWLVGIYRTRNNERMKNEWVGGRWPKKCGPTQLRWWKKEPACPSV